MKRILGAIVTAVALVGAQAQVAPAQTSMLAPDGQFMVEAARGGIAEVELGRLASQRGANAAVRQFGQRMATDHGAANQELMQLAQRKGMTLPTEMGPGHRATMDRLATMTGPAFDNAYMIAMVKDHQHDAAAFTRQAQQGQDPDVRAWAMKTLPTIHEHQRLANDLHSRLAQAPAAPATVMAPAASPATVTTVVTTTVPPPPPFCGGAYVPGVGTNFGSCVK